MNFISWEEAVNWLVAQPEQRELVKACYFDRPVEKAARRYWQSTEWQAVRKYFPSGGKQALDLGAGNGIASYALAKDGWKVTALEPDASEWVGIGAIQELSRSGSLGIRIIIETGENIPCQDQSFDMVFARQVLHHAADLGALCRQVCRVLKPGGRFLALREHVITRGKDLPRFLDRHPLHHLYGKENAHRCSTYRKTIEASGLELITVLGPFDSVINYAPMSEATLRMELSRRVNQIPGGRVFQKALRNDGVFRAGLRILSKLDQRPGRLFSFICKKPLE